MLEYVAALIIAIGLITLYLLVKKDFDETRALLLLIVSIIFLGGGAWILVKNLAREVLFVKIRGLISIIVGLFLLIKFPDLGSFQPMGYSITGIFIGLILLILGLYWLII